MTNVATYTTIADIDTDAVAGLYGLEGLRLEGLDGGFANSSFIRDTEITGGTGR
jgi:hypothetical protein